MKAMLLAVAVIVVVIGIFAYVVHTDPNRGLGYEIPDGVTAWK
jgi:hypothetical protein